MARISRVLNEQFIYTNWPASIFKLATFFHDATEHFEIIDSYSGQSTPNRYKGDPITNGSWASSSDVGSNNNWFVVRCKTSIHTGLPNWELKIQWTNSVAFDDVSGLDYGNEGSIRNCYGRFAPRGGWNLADTNPDFAPAGSPSYVSSQNQPFIRSDNTHVLMTFDDGQIVSVRREVASYYNISFFGGFVGDINPVSASDQPMPRVFFSAGGACSVNGSNGAIGNNSMLCEDGFTCSTSYAVIGFEDSSTNWQETGFSLPSNAALMRVQASPNRYGTTPELDIAPYQPMPIGYGLIGDIPCLGLAQGVGGTLFNNKEWLSTTASYCLVMRWDGTTGI